MNRRLHEIDSELIGPTTLTSVESISPPPISSPKTPYARVAQQIHFQQRSDLVFRVADLYFDFGRIRLGDDLFDVLDQSVESMPVAKIGHIYLEAYCDDRGGVAYSLALAGRRIEMVRQYFLDLGVLPQHVQAVNYGPLRPVCRESNSECRESHLRIQSTLHFFAILKPQFGCVTRIKLVHDFNRSEERSYPGQPIVHRQIRLAPLLRHR